MRWTRPRSPDVPREVDSASQGHVVDPIAFRTQRSLEMISNSSTIHETVQRLNAELENADLLLLKSKPKFLSKKTHDNQEWPAASDGSEALQPSALATNVEFQKASGDLRCWYRVYLKTRASFIQKFLRNLKFRYLEQAAKKKYVVEIMSEEGPAISAADNEQLKAKNEEKKKALRVVKDKLNEKQKDIRDLGPLVEEGLDSRRFHQHMTLMHNPPGPRL